MSDTTIARLNVGGTIFATTLGTLRTYKGSIISQMFSQPYAVPYEQEKDGTLNFFVDRNGEVFGLILDYLRSGTLAVPRDPVQYVVLRREVAFYGLPIASQLPAAQPLVWEAAPCRYKHARVVVDEIEKSISWEEGALPQDIYARSVPEIIAFFGGRGYKIVSEYASRGSKGYCSIWLAKKERYPAADVGVEVMDTVSSPPALSGLASVPGSGTAPLYSSRLGSLPLSEPTNSPYLSGAPGPSAYSSQPPMAPTATGGASAPRAAPAKLGAGKTTTFGRGPAPVAPSSSALAPAGAGYRGEIRVLLFGLEGSGKTTILQTLLGGRPFTSADMERNSGFLLEPVPFGVDTLMVLDLDVADQGTVGGQQKPHWRNFRQNAQGVVFVVDSNDRYRIATAIQEFNLMIEDEVLTYLPVLVLANKQDLPDAMSTSEISDKLGLHQMGRAKQWYIVGCSGARGLGIQEGFGWLLEAMKGSNL